MDWQPIESIPRDGSKVLIANRFGEMWVGWMDGGWQGRPFWSNRPDEMEPAHWMPLPEPPHDRP